MEEEEIIPQICQKPQIQRLSFQQKRLSTQPLFERQQILLQQQLLQNQQGPQRSIQIAKIQRRKPIITKRPNILNRISITR